MKNKKCVNGSETAHTIGTMRIFLIALVSAYILAVNVYAFLLIRRNKRTDEQNPNKKMLLTGLLGGAVTAYVCMFTFRYKLDNIILMVLLPILAVVNVYVFFMAIRGGMGITVL